MSVHCDLRSISKQLDVFYTVYKCFARLYCPMRFSLTTEQRDRTVLFVAPEASQPATTAVRICMKRNLLGTKKVSRGCRMCGWKSKEGDISVYLNIAHIRDMK